MKQQKMRRADAHIHLFKNGYPAHYGEAFARANELQCYEALRQEHQIEKALIVGFEGQPQFAGNNRYLARLGKTHGWMAPLCYLNCRQVPTNAVLREPFVGIALYIDSREDIECLTHWPEQLYSLFNNRRAIISVNTSPACLKLLPFFVEKFQHCPILISHLGLPGRFAKEPSATAAKKAMQPLCNLATYPNVMVKLSGFYGVSDPAWAFPHQSTLPLVSAIYESFGARRLLWGSDFSPCLGSVSFVQTVEVLEVLNQTLKWPEKEMQQIRGGNLLGLL